LNTNSTTKNKKTTVKSTVTDKKNDKNKNLAAAETTSANKNDHKQDTVLDVDMKTDETPAVITTNNKNTTDKFNSTLNTTANNNNLSANTSAAFGSTSIINTTVNNHHNEETMMSDITTTSVIHGNLPELSHTVWLGTAKAGFVLAVGENLSNQLGLGCEIDDRKKPQLVKELPTNIVQVAAGGMHSAVLTEDGFVSYLFHINKHFHIIKNLF
jgi:hypothetical protein